MLTDPEEIKIIANARQKNVADPRRSREHFVRIYEDFFNDITFTGKQMLDLGPGQSDFGELAKKRGGLTYGIDNDPCVVELGNYKGFPSVHGDLKKISKGMFDTNFDGLFCKYSINAFWFHDKPGKLEEHIGELVSLLNPGGWAWIAPWNGVPKKADLSEAEIQGVLDLQIALFKAAGFQAIDLTDELTKYYGVHGVTANNALFLLNIPVPQKLSGYSLL
ncbi:class I SAM-dependent methyltransferase [Deltaproteobacteria bacterium]|nr:class I SAM-dependent methyltransferase [Deltaproteobacteria bacterium]